jgi:hypothetical protein
MSFIALLRHHAFTSLAQITAMPRLLKSKTALAQVSPTGFFFHQTVDFAGPSSRDLGRPGRVADSAVFSCAIRMYHTTPANKSSNGVGEEIRTLVSGS